MLILSDRHTASDLQCWTRLQSADHDRGATLALAKKVTRSLGAIRQFADAGPCYAGISWGKDSVVLAGLIREASVDIPLVWVRVEPIANPDCLRVRDAMFKQWPNHPPYHEIHIDCPVDANGPHATGTLELGFDRAAELTGTRRHLSGIRANESGARKISLRMLGLASENACRPLGWWYGDEVFAFLASRRLPVHPAYAMLGGGRWERKHIRVASLGGKRGDQFGRAIWEREYYGDVLNRLAKMDA